MTGSHSTCRAPDAVQIILHRGATAKDTKTGQQMIAQDPGLLRWASDHRGVAG